MITITLKDIPPALHGTLKNQADLHGRSLNREIIDVLQRAVRSEPIDAASLMSQAREAREAAGLYVTRRDLSDLKKRGRA